MVTIHSNFSLLQEHREPTIDAYILQNDEKKERENERNYSFEIKLTTIEVAICINMIFMLNFHFLMLQSD